MDRNTMTTTLTVRVAPSLSRGAPTRSTDADIFFQVTDCVDPALEDAAGSASWDGVPFRPGDGREDPACWLIFWTR